MANTLVFPDGVRLANREEIPGTENARATVWARIQAAKLTQGFVLKRAEGEQFKFYAEANVHAPLIWAVFRDLCRALLTSEATLIFSETDADPSSLGSAEVSTIIDALGRYEYQLAHDGFLQFGIVSDQVGAHNEVFVAPTKHLMIWLNDEMRFRWVMESYGIPEASRLEFLDEYPRTTITLPPDKGALRDIGELAKRLEDEVNLLPLLSEHPEVEVWTWNGSHFSQCKSP